jgi:hypothetical protein
MHADAEAFLSEIRATSKFQAAAARDPIYEQHLGAIEHGLRIIYAAGADDPRAIEMFDEIRTILKGKDKIGARAIALRDFLAENRPVIEAMARHWPRA